MRWKWAAFAWTLLAFLIAPVFAQYQGATEKLLITAQSAATWSQDKTSIIQLNGPVSIETDQVKLSARNAVIWLKPAPGGLLEEQQFDIALIGDAQLKQADNNVTRSADQLLVSGIVRGAIRVTANDRVAKNLADSDLYRSALSIKNGAATPATPAHPGASATGHGGSPTLDTTAPGPLPSSSTGGTALNPRAPTSTSNRGPVEFHAKLVEQVPSEDGNVVVALSGGVTLTQVRENGDFLELLASKMVLFTDSKAGQFNVSTIGQHVTSVYLEGDVRVNLTPALPQHAEQRMTADRCYYDLVTDRAVLTDVVLHTIDPASQIPIVVRARKVRQLSKGELDVDKADLTTSAFAVPTYSVRVSSAYLRQYATPDGESHMDFVAHDDTLRVFGAPIFYLPYMAGTIDRDGFPLRDFSIQDSKRFGFGETSEWGLFEVLGKRPPQDLDISFHTDYYSARGFAFGLDGKYGGSVISETTHDPWSFTGDFKSYMIFDKGLDDLGGGRTIVTPPNQFRGRILWEHEHFFPDDWQVQVRAGYVSDPTFLEEYYRPEFDDGLPHNLSFYVKRQHDTEAITFLAQGNSTPFTTNAEQQQEQFDIERLPEVGYRRIGDSVGDDLTFFSNNSASRLRFVPSNASLAQQGFYPGLSPGIPAQGYTGTTSGAVYRADTKQELDWPLQLGEFKFVPYVQERLTEYSDSPARNSQTRLFSSAGVRLTTAFWKVDDSAESELFDIHRIRHVIQPEINLFTSGSTVDRSHLFIYDENVDGISDVSAAQIALHQRWQTMRGGPGKWRSVDFLEINVEGNFFTNQPPQGQLAPPNAFRGVFFPSDVESSIPRQGINGDLTWRISDTTAVLSDAQWNLDQRELATASIGAAVQRDERLTYFVGDRYIQALQSQIVSVSADYQLTQKYRILIGQSVDFGAQHDINTSFTLVRKFDNVSASVSIYHDATTNESGFNFNILPLGLTRGSSAVTGLVGY